MDFPRINIPSPFNPTYKGIRKYDEDMSRALSDLTSALSNIFERGLNLADNFDVQFIAYTSNGTPDTEDEIAHTLKRTPTGYIIVKQDKAGQFYAGSTAWTDTKLYLKSDVATVAATVMIF